MAAGSSMGRQRNNNVLRQWEDIPDFMRNEKVKVYYEILIRKRFQLRMKRIFDVTMSLILILLLSPVFFCIAVWIRLDSNGPVFYSQERITQYGRKFRIIKFRTMVVNADQKGSLVTVKNDSRITKAGEKIRKLRIDELPQLFNILKGDMSFVGTRPEVGKYVAAYTDEMKATLLLPAGVTSQASIRFKNEEVLLQNAENVDEIYVREILPRKMEWNLKAIRELGVLKDMYIIIETILAVAGVSV